MLNLGWNQVKGKLKQDVENVRWLKWKSKFTVSSSHFCFKKKKEKKRRRRSDMMKLCEIVRESDLSHGDDVLCTFGLRAARTTPYHLCESWNLVCILTSCPSVISAVLYGAMALGEANAFAPNYAKAKMSASHLMMLINREPAIDNLSQEGESPVHNTKPHTPDIILTIQLFTHISLFCLLS